jgi:hypothetical protein
MFKSNNLNESVTLGLRTGVISHQFVKKAIPYEFKEVNQVVKSIDLDMSKSKDLKNKSIQIQLIPVGMDVQLSYVNGEWVIGTKTMIRANECTFSGIVKFD